MCSQTIQAPILIPRWLFILLSFGHGVLMPSLCTGMFQALEPNRQTEPTATGAKGMERNAIDSCGDKWIFI